MEKRRKHESVWVVVRQTMRDGRREGRRVGKRQTGPRIKERRKKTGRNDKNSSLGRNLTNGRNKGFL